MLSSRDLTLKFELNGEVYRVLMSGPGRWAIQHLKGGLSGDWEIVKNDAVTPQMLELVKKCEALFAS